MMLNHNKKAKLSQVVITTLLALMTIGGFQAIALAQKVPNLNTYDESSPLRSVEEMPQFPGNVMEYLSKNLSYPDTTTEGTVAVEFVVNTDGAISDVKILKSLNEAFDKEAVRVIKAMPNWIPGKQNGIAKAVYYTVPIRFQK